MKISNPGVLDGSITTAKVSTTDFNPTYTGDLDVKGKIAALFDVYPHLHLVNAAGTYGWSIYHNSAAGEQGYLAIESLDNGTDWLRMDDAGLITLFNPLPVGSGGTGAASLAAAGIGQVVASGTKTGAGIIALDVLDFTVVDAGYYQVSVSTLFTDTSGNAGTVRVAAESNTTNSPQNAEGPTNSYLAGVGATVGGTFVLKLNAGDVLRAYARVASGSTAGTFEAVAVISRLA